MLIASSLQAQVTEYDLFKVIIYHQTSGDAPSTPDVPDACYFSSRVVTDPAYTTTAARLATPVRSEYPYFGRSPTTFTVNSSFLATSTDLDRCFPPGQYYFAVSCLDPSNTSRILTGHLQFPDTDLYATNIPAFTGDTWDTMQHADPGTTLMLKWNTYSRTPGANSARTFLDVFDDATGELRFRVNRRPIRNWVTIPPNTLAYGHTYTVRMYFSERIVSHEDMGFGKAESIVGFDKLVHTSLVTIPQPQTQPAETNVAPALTKAATAPRPRLVEIDAAADTQAPPVIVPEATVPWLQIQVMGTKVLVRWPAAAVNYELETATDLAPPNTLWSIVTNQPTTDGVTAQLLLPAPGDRGFFRLNPK
jgi:hypothetical protein